MAKISLIESLKSSPSAFFKTLEISTYTQKGRQNSIVAAFSLVLIFVFQKDGLSVFELEDPDVVCLQETKCNDAKIPEEAKNVKGYKSYFMSGK